jgi:hypothetical protein
MRFKALPTVELAVFSGVLVMGREVIICAIAFKKSKAEVQNFWGQVSAFNKIAFWKKACFYSCLLVFSLME